jgi:UDP-3-O-[3-hydroxymyristoyl] glucosamine N-acyltransferase
VVWTLGQLAGLVNGRVRGDESTEINSVATLQDASRGQISFLTNKQYKSFLTSTKASAVIIDNEADCSTNLLIVENPHAAYAKIAQLLYSPQKPEPGIHPSASVHTTSRVDDSAQIGPNVVIEENVTVDAGVSVGANCFIGAGTKIGRDTQINPLVTIYHSSEIGERCIVYSSSVIGADGFGHAYDGEGWLKIPQLGKVIIGNDVEIGSNTTVDRGAIGDTIIEDGVKLDNQIQIAHNVQIGANTVMAASVAVAGSAKIGKNCMIGGLTGIAGHLEITDNVVITAMSMVIKSIDEAGSYSSGIPVEPSKIWRRYVGRFKRLESLSKRLAKCEETLKNKD